MDEQRQEARRKLFTALPVYDGISSRIVGHVVDLTRTGMMLSCEDPVGIQEEFWLRLRFPEPVEGKQELMVRGVCRWCRESGESGTFVAGFQLHDIGPESERLLSCLLDAFCTLSPPVHASSSSLKSTPCA